MHNLNRQLQEIFLFTSADVRANRSGRLSERQQARLRAAVGSQRLAMMIFGVIMISTLAVLIFSTLLSQTNAGVTPSDYWPQIAIIAGVIGAVVVIGILASRPYLTKAAPKQMLMALGPARYGRVLADSARYELQIGAAKVRLTTEEQLRAFELGVEYRLFYIPGPVPTILSGEVVGSEAETDALAAAELPLEQDPALQLHRRARPILYVLAVLTIGVPLVGFAASALPPVARWLVMIGLLAVGVGFVYWALRRVGR